MTPIKTNTLIIHKQIKAIKPSTGLNRFSIKLLVIALLASLIIMPGCSKDDVPNPLNSTKYTELNAAMRKLWADHMQYTYATVDAYYNNQPALQSSLNRLLQNQKDIGAAIVPYYGKVAGDTLEALLTIHINQAVPVLQAAKDNNQAALAQAIANWHANAKDIANFLTAANPNNWPKVEMETSMGHHIDETTTYAVDLLQKNYTKAIQDYDHAFAHMMDVADILAKGIALQFPNKF